MILKSQLNSNTSFSTYVDEESLLDSYNFKHWFDLSNNIIHYKLINESENKTYIDVSIPFSEIKNHVNFADQTMWGINNDSLSKTTLSGSDLVPLLTLSLIKKNPVLISSEFGAQFSPFRIFVPGKNSSLEDCVFQIKIPDTTVDSFPDVNVSVGGPSYTNEQIGSLANWKNLIQTPSLQSTITPGNIKVDVTVTDTDISEVFLESIVGSVDRTRVVLTNGVGRFNISTSSLQTGEVVRVKLGYKYFTGVTEFTATV